jgi:hypothetical protein
MRRPIHHRVHSAGLFRLLWERMRRWEQMLVRGREDWPLLLLSFPAAERHIAEELRGAWLHTLPLLQASAAQPYLEMLRTLPPVVVVLLRKRNVCTCLGHHHPRGTESRLTRGLMGDSGEDAGEIDLAWEAIRNWRPHPLATLALQHHPSFEELHFRTALLTVLVHELEHLAYPEHKEDAVRRSSDDFYASVLEELLAVRAES